MSNKNNKKYNRKSRLVRNRAVYAKATLNNKSDNFNKKIYIVLFISLAFNLLCFNSYFISQSTALAKEVTKEKEDVKEKEVIKVPDNYLFLGDSITEYYDLNNYYPNMPVINSGIAGNTTEDILDEMQERVYQYNPSKVFILIGTNDLQKGKKIDDIVNNIDEIIKEIKTNREYAEIYLQSIYPVDESRDAAESRKNADINEINKKLKKIAKENKITYIDVHSILADEDSTIKTKYTKDGLHLSPEGYKVVTKCLAEYL